MAGEWLFLLLPAAAAVFALLHRRQAGQLRAAQRALDNLRTEESRVFDFMHRLGEAFGQGTRPGRLQKLIVEGVTTVLEAHGGALYLPDRSGRFLSPAYVSRSCFPLVRVPEQIREQSRSNPVALESFLRLHAIQPGEGPLGLVWQQGGCRLFNSADRELQDLSTTGQEADSALVAALVYRGKTLGVLAVVNGPMSHALEASDLPVFQAIADQSAFALFTEAVYSEAGEKRRLDHDLQVAREIQGILLPSASPEVPGFEISGLNIPARHVSGDYFDYIPLGGGRTGIAIADVSGKGIPASLIMAMCRSVLRSVAPGRTSAAEVLHLVNRQLYPDIKEDMFISMLYLVADPATGTLTMARAGHDAPFLLRASDRTVTPLRPPGMAVGIDSGDVFDRIVADEAIAMTPGDALLLYTDGVTEALDEYGTEFGPARVVQTLQAQSGKEASAVVEKIASDLRGFAGQHPQHDDITLICIRKA